MSLISNNRPLVSGEHFEDQWSSVYTYRDSPGDIKVRVGEHRTGKDTDSTIETTGDDVLVEKILLV